MIERQSWYRLVNRVRAILRALKFNSCSSACKTADLSMSLSRYVPLGSSDTSATLHILFPPTLSPNASENRKSWVSEREFKQRSYWSAREKRLGYFFAQQLPIFSHSVETDIRKLARPIFLFFFFFVTWLLNGPDKNISLYVHGLTFSFLRHVSRVTERKNAIITRL